MVRPLARIIRLSGESCRRVGASRVHWAILRGKRCHPMLNKILKLKSLPCLYGDRTASGRVSETGRRRRRIIRARWPRRHWRTSSETRSRPHTGSRTCSNLGAGSWTTGRAIWAEKVDNRRPDCSVGWNDGHPPKPLGEKMILTAEKWRIVPIREWERDLRGGFTKSGPDDSQSHFPRSLCLSISCGRILESGGAARGNRRWTGTLPLFCLPDRRRGGRCFDTRRIAGEVAPVPSIPADCFSECRN